MNLTFRSATPDDAQRVSDLVNSAYRGESSKRGWTTEADLLGGQRTDSEEIGKIISAPRSRIELAYDADGLVGSVYLKRENDAACYLGMLTVNPVRQAKGLGSEIILHAEKVARLWECRSIRMTVIHSRTELIAFYERRGYLRTGETAPFPTDDPRFGIPKVPLHFVVLAKPL